MWSVDALRENLYQSEDRPVQLPEQVQDDSELRSLNWECSSRLSNNTVAV